MLEDASLPAAAKRQKLLCSMHCPALDIAREQSGKSVKEFYCYLVEFYAPSSNGITLSCEYLSTCMNEGESNIDYFQRLSVMLDRIVKNEGLQENVQCTLLTHFKSTCKIHESQQAILTAGYKVKQKGQKKTSVVSLKRVTLKKHFHMTTMQMVSL